MVGRWAPLHITGTASSISLWVTFLRMARFYLSWSRYAGYCTLYVCMHQRHRLWAQILVDMSVFGVLHIMAFFTWMTLAEGGTWTDVKTKIKQDFPPTYCAALMFWPMYMAFVFSQVPVSMQLLAVNIGCLVDATFMCWCEG